MIDASATIDLTELADLVRVYLNRTSELVFILSRVANADAAHDDPLWRRRA